MEILLCIGFLFLLFLLINLSGFARILRKRKDTRMKTTEEFMQTQQKPDEEKTEPPHLTAMYTYGNHMYRSRGEDPSVYFVDGARKIRKEIVDYNGWIQSFPGIEKETFWEKEISSGSLMPQIRFRTDFEKREDKFIMLWQVQPDGRYWEDDDGFGMTPEEEIVLYTFIDMEGNFTGPFKIYRMGWRSYYTEADKQKPL